MRRAALLIALSLSGPAAAHDWYPTECCHAKDCAPVDRVEIVAGALFYAGHTAQSIPPSVMIVTTIHGTAAVPDDLQRLPSHDNRMHACIYKRWSMETRDYSEPTVRCIFFPPTN